MRGIALLLLAGVAIGFWAGEALAAQDDGAEMPLREKLGLPPYRRFVLVRVEGKNEDKVAERAREVADEVRLIDAVVLVDALTLLVVLDLESIAGARAAPGARHAAARVVAVVLRPVRYGRHVAVRIVR